MYDSCRLVARVLRQTVLPVSLYFVKRPNSMFHVVARARHIGAQGELTHNVLTNHGEYIVSYMQSNIPQQLLVGKLGATPFG
eukprot:2544494-Pyramimonas_sp.AAC.1